MRCNIRYKWTTDKSGFDSRQGRNIFMFSWVSRQVVRPAHFLIQSLPEIQTPQSEGKYSHSVVPALKITALIIISSLRASPRRDA